MKTLIATFLFNALVVVLGLNSSENPDLYQDDKPNIQSIEVIFHNQEEYINFFYAVSRILKNNFITAKCQSSDVNPYFIKISFALAVSLNTINELKRKLHNHFKEFLTFKENIIV